MRVFNYSVGIIIPTKNRHGNRVAHWICEDMLKEAKEALTIYAGGYTSLNGFGGYLEGGVEVSEHVVIVQSFCHTSGDYADALAGVKAIALKYKELADQDSVAVLTNDGMELV